MLITSQVSSVAVGVTTTVGASTSSVISTSDDVISHPLSLSVTTTLYVPIVVTSILAVVSPLLHK